LFLRALREGASGYIWKGHADDVLAAIRAVERGSRFVSPKLDELLDVLAGDLN
jgi:DNA-binding NarL/FixJ family response regulator